MTFEKFLEDKWAEQNPEETYNDDHQDDRFDDWLAQLDGEEYIEFGNEYGELRATER